MVLGVVWRVVEGVTRGWFREWSGGWLSLYQVDEDLVCSSVPPFQNLVRSSVPPFKI